MELILSGVITAAVGALAILAYRHPENFYDFGRVLGVVILAAYFSVLIFDLGANEAQLAFAKSSIHLNLKDIEPIKKAIIAVRVVTPMTHLVALGLLIYLWVLSKLPSFGLTAFKAHKESDAGEASSDG